MQTITGVGEVRNSGREQIGAERAIEETYRSGGDAEGVDH